jgi:succinoglycan biosynthesis transport protein ExoP
MLQANKTAPVDERNAIAGSASPAELFSSVVSFVRRQYPVILAVGLLALALGVVYLLTTPPSFTGRSTLLIDTRKVQVFQQPTMIGDPTINTGMVDSQVEILKSENISLAVIKELRLIEDPEFAGSGGGLLGRLIGFVSDFFGPAAPKSEFELTRRAVRALADRLSVRRVGLSYIIEISFVSLDPERAAQIANAVADGYIVDQLEAKYQATRRASVWLQDRIRELRDQASAAERAVVEFKGQHNIVGTGTGGRLMNEQQLAEINSQLVLARAQTAEARARLDRIDDIRRAGAPDATVTDSLRNDVITKLRQQYLDLKNREADWSNRYGRTHLAAVQLRNQMSEIRRSILDELGRIAETYKSDFEIAKQREEVIQKSLGDAVSESKTTNHAQIALRELESTSQTYRALHDNFLQRYMESLQQQSFPITEARVVTPASRPLEKSHPKGLLVLAIAGVGGLMLGFGVAALRDMADRVFRTSGQVEAALQADCLSVVPAVKGMEAKAAAARAPADGGSPAPRTIVSSTPIFRQVIDAPFSRFTESIRSIKVAVDINGVGRTSKVIGFTSSLPNEGKSTVSCALAQLIAHTGSRVILVDCDLRNPSLTRALAPRVSAGILDVLSAKLPIEDIVWTDPTTNLAFLPAPAKSRFAHTSEVLGSDATKWLFERLREKYDYVIVDLSPLAPVVDVRSTSHFVDSYVFVVEWGKTNKDLVEQSLNAARGVYQNLLGVVLNKSDTSVHGRYDGVHGNYYHKKYYARYGYTD